MEYSKLLEMKRNPISIKRIIVILSLYLVSSNMIAQKINLDTLNVDQLNLYKAKAVKLRNTGKVLTLAGLPVCVISEGLAIYILFSHSQPSEGSEDSNINWNVRGSICAKIGLAGFTSVMVGTPLWIIGGKRINKAALALKTFNIVPENSLALGVGVTLRF